jgi:hypothetical protein
MIPLPATSPSPFWVRYGMIWAPTTARLPGHINRKSAKIAAQPPRVSAAGCEAHHTHVTALALIRAEARPAPVSKDRTDESAADGLLVVQVCRLGTVSGKVPQAASPLIVAAATAGSWPLPLNRTIPQPNVFFGAMPGRGMPRRSRGAGFGAEGLGKLEPVVIH